MRSGVVEGKGGAYLRFELPLLRQWPWSGLSSESRVVVKSIFQLLKHEFTLRCRTSRLLEFLHVYNASESRTFVFDLNSDHGGLPSFSTYCRYFYTELFALCYSCYS